MQYGDRAIAVLRREPLDNGIRLRFSVLHTVDFRTELLTCRKHTLRTFEITFPETTPSNRNQLRQNFTGKHRLTWHAALQTFGALRILPVVVTKTTYRFTHFQSADFHTWPLGLQRI